MPSIIDQLTEIYVFIDDHLKQHPEKAQWRGSNNAEPAFSDAEVLTKSTAVSHVRDAFGARPEGMTADNETY